MCSIMGIEKSQFGKQHMRQHFYKSIHRGPDDTRIKEYGNTVLGFHRLAIMGLHKEGMQPFERGELAIVCNGEIYGFRSIKKKLEDKYQFKSESDCEILLPLYLEMGTEMFKELDAEFALIISDGKKLIAARDPIGIRPLFYGYPEDGGIIFASEAINLEGLVNKIIPFPPGHYYQDGKFIRYADLTTVDEYLADDIDVICDNIRDKLCQGVIKRLDSDAPLGFLLSGGLDSSLVCAIAAKALNKKIRTFAIGMEKDAIDLKYARKVADYIGSFHQEFYMNRNEVLKSLDKVIEILATYDITTIRASLGMYLCGKKIKENTDIKVLMTGEISDELFGYKYTDFAPNASQFQKEACKRIKELYMYDVLRADRCISSNSLEGRVPFGDIEFVEYVMSIDPELKMNKYNIGKYLLRHAFEEDKLLPESILFRDKAAFSDAVGHSLVEDIKEYANEYYSDLMFERLSKSYKHCAPYTKESLLYREIFEKYYPDLDELICAYWLPNQNWEGCKVDDPSARVLSNYGKSGI